MVKILKGIENSIIKILERGNGREYGTRSRSCSRKMRASVRERVFRTD